MGLYVVNGIVYNHKRFKDITKEERAKACDNIICPKCKYNNYKRYIEKFGTCHLCGTTLDKDFFKKRLKRKLGG